jgi:hypothetical protein
VPTRQWIDTPATRTVTGVDQQLVLADDLELSVRVCTLADRMLGSVSQDDEDSLPAPERIEAVAAEHPLLLTNLRAGDSTRAGG